MKEIQAGFNAPRPDADPYVLGQYERLGLAAAPSLADLEPHATEMMRSGQILEGIGLVLGRHVSVTDLQTDKSVHKIAMAATRQPEQAFGMLLLHLCTEEIKAEESA